MNTLRDPKTVIYTPKRDDNHHPFSMGDTPEYALGKPGLNKRWKKHSICFGYIPFISESSLTTANITIHVTRRRRLQSDSAEVGSHRRQLDSVSTVNSPYFSSVSNERKTIPDARPRDSKNSSLLRLEGKGRTSLRRLASA